MNNLSIHLNAHYGYLPIAALSLVLTACGGGSTAAPEAVPAAAPAEAITGILYDAPLANVAYSGSFAGTTDDSGQFQYAADEQLVFSIGNFSFPALTPKPLTGLADLLQADELDSRVINLARFVQSIDLSPAADVIELPDLLDIDISALDLNLSLADFEASEVVQRVLTQNSSQIAPGLLIPAQDAVDHLYTSAATLGATLPAVSPVLDYDGDRLLNSVDADDDNDGVVDVNDAFPLDETEAVDTDSDGVGNNRDIDDDGDGVADENDAFPLDDTEVVDTDSDGIGNNKDIDDDGDGVADENDAFPLDDTEAVGTDSDGVGNNTDTDDDDEGDFDSDGDGVADADDAFPFDSSESADTDSDGIGNNADVDDDNDGLIEISSLQDLDWVRNNLDGSAFGDGSASSAEGCVNTGCIGYELTQHLDFDINNDGVMDASDAPYYDYDGNGSHAGWLPIGGSPPFTAVFDGNGYEIRNLTINRPDLHSLGLFGYIKGAQVKNIGLSGELMSVVGLSEVGGLVGLAWNSIVSNSYSSGATAGGFHTGGLVGLLYQSVVSNSYATGTVTSIESMLDAQSRYFGGLAGSGVAGSTISSSYASGTVMGAYANGGLVGQLLDSTVSSSYATATVTADATVSVATDYASGGLVGYLSDSTVSSSYATGTVTVPVETGGLAGVIVSSTISNCHWVNDSAALITDSFGIIDDDSSAVGIVGATLAQLQCPVSASDTACVSGETLYKNWDAIDHDNNANTDTIAPWIFGDSNTLPTLDMSIEIPSATD